MSDKPQTVSEDCTQSSDKHERKFLMFCREWDGEPPWMGVVVIADTDPAQVVDVLLAKSPAGLSSQFADWVTNPRLPKSALQ